ncbi:GatB/YqeY domain-containing protein [Candidatus Microgenomates bacterium]|nr:GatB/YqeY domain-containing protein [Candidatus Microgenomates bacterium]
MIANTLQKQIGDAMKARDSVRVSTLKMLSTAFAYEKIEVKRDLTDEEELVIIAKEAKKRTEAVEMYKKAGAVDKVEQETAELKILNEYLPEQMSDTDLEKLVDGAISKLNPTGMSDMGKVIGMVKASAGATAEGSKIANMVREKLS